MKILITGGCGFVGSNLAIYLKKRLKNSKISSLDNLFSLIHVIQDEVDYENDTDETERWYN